jgi:hydroxyacyl-ACP dehydratase HTD2-like protein with hotdog domain
MTTQTTGSSAPRREDVAVGTPIAPLEKRPTSVQLFRYSAITWNAHLIHYNREYAATEGYPDILVQSHLHGCFLIQAVLDWAGPGARLRRFRWENRHLAVPGDVLTCTGQVTTVRDEGERRVVECELYEHNQDGKLCAPGWAVVELPPAPTSGGQA